jgi:hypothetical protein
VQRAVRERRERVEAAPRRPHLVETPP